MASARRDIPDPTLECMNETTTAASHRHDHALQERRLGVGGHLLARWPSVLGLLALLSNAAGGAESHLVGMIIITASMCYLAAAALGSRRAGWIMIGVSVVVILATGLLGLDKTAAILVMGGGFAIFGFLRGTAIDRRELGLQVAAFVGFCSLALAAMMSAPLLSMYLAAAAAIGHAVWDVIYFLREKVVERSVTEFCFVLDLGLGIALLLTAWNLLPL